MPLPTRTLRYVLFFALTVLSVSCDQGTKVWARASLQGKPDVPVISGFWDWHFAENPGGAFSLLRDVPGGRYILTAIGIALLGMLFWWLRKTIDKGTLPIAALALIAGGAIGNLYDRIVFGRVTDFIFWHVKSFRWPVFNVADVLLLVGAVLLFFAMPRETPTDTAPSA